MTKRRNLYCTCCNASGTRRDLTHGDGICECGAYYTSSEKLALATSGVKPLATIAKDGSITGKASDGTVVSLGHVFWVGPVEHGADAIQNYLSTHPTPDTW